MKYYKNNENISCINKAFFHWISNCYLPRVINLFLFALKMLQPTLLYKVHICTCTFNSYVIHNEIHIEQKQGSENHKPCKLVQI